MPIFHPKFIAIDSSLLGQWASDACSPDLVRQKQATLMTKELFDSNWIPVLYWHHFEELARHEKEEVVESRIKFLLSLPFLGWVARADGRTEIIGSVIDLQAHEIKTFLSHSHCNTFTKEFVGATRSSFLKIGKPSDIPMLFMWRNYHPYLVAMGLKQQEVASVCHVMESKHDNVPLSVLNSKKAMSWEQANYLYSEELSLFTNQISSKGDKRLSDPEDLAGRFCDLVFSNIANTSAKSLPLAEAFVENFGFSIADFPQNVTLGEFKEAVTRRNKLSTVIDQLALRLEDVWPRLRDRLMPSEEIVLEIRKSRINAKRASGSDLNDDYHATLIPYLDAVVVDKRTHEYLRQAKIRKPKIPLHLKQVIKASFYHQIPEILRNQKKSS